MNIKFLTNLDNKIKYAIILVLVICLVLILFLLSRFNEKKNIVDDIPIEASNAQVSLPPITPKATVPPSILKELEYPLLYEEVTFDFRPRSGTFIISYSGDKTKAEQAYIKFMRHMNLDSKDYLTHYRSIDPITPLPRVFDK